MRGQIDFSTIQKFERFLTSPFPGTLQPAALATLRQIFLRAMITVLWMPPPKTSLSNPLSAP
jgi:hypothetical protein